jgi:hypothetical protein
MDSHIDEAAEASPRGRDRTVFLAMSLVVLISAWVIASPFFWVQGRTAASLTSLCGLLAAGFSVMSLLHPTLRWGVALTGVVLAFSGLVHYGLSAAVANHLVCGVLLVVLSLFHGPLEEKRAAQAVGFHVGPLSAQARRFVHGLGWGAVATVAMGVVTLLVLGVHLWPLPAPLAFLGAHRLLGTSMGMPAALLLLGVVELGYGALCGGLLTVVCDPVDLSHALALGALRWLTTQVVVFPALGLADFGLDAGTAPMLATALPQLVYAVSLGLLMRRDDRRVLGLAHATPS